MHSLTALLHGVLIAACIAFCAACGSYIAHNLTHQCERQP
jgi:hypothetical protein